MEHARQTWQAIHQTDEIWSARGVVQATTRQIGSAHGPLAFLPPVARTRSQIFAVDGRPVTVPFAREKLPCNMKLVGVIGSGLAGIVIMRRYRTQATTA